MGKKQTRLGIPIFRSIAIWVDMCAPNLIICSQQLRFYPLVRFLSQGAQLPWLRRLHLPIWPRQMSTRILPRSSLFRDVAQNRQREERVLRQESRQRGESQFLKIEEKARDTFNPINSEICIFIRIYICRKGTIKLDLPLISLHFHWHHEPKRCQKVSEIYSFEIKMYRSVSYIHENGECMERYSVIEDSWKFYQGNP